MSIDKFDSEPKFTVTEIPDDIDPDWREGVLETIMTEWSVEQKMELYNAIERHNALSDVRGVLKEAAEDERKITDGEKEK